MIKNQAQLSRHLTTKGIHHYPHGTDLLVPAARLHLHYDDGSIDCYPAPVDGSTREEALHHHLEEQNAGRAGMAALFYQSFQAADLTKLIEYIAEKTQQEERRSRLLALLGEPEWLVAVIWDGLTRWRKDTGEEGVGSYVVWCNTQPLPESIPDDFEGIPINVQIQQSK